MKKILRNLFLFFLLIFCNRNSSAQCMFDFSYSNLGGGQIRILPILNDPTLSLLQIDFGDGNGMVQQDSLPAYNTYTYNYTAHVCMIVSTAGCFDSVCKDIVVTGAALDPICTGSAAFNDSANGTLTDFKNNSSHWQIADFGDGSPASNIDSGLIQHQYTNNGTYLVKSISYINVAMGINVYVGCDTLYQNIVVANVPCQSNFSSFADSTNNMLYTTNLTLGSSNSLWYLDGVPVSTNYSGFSASITQGNHDVCLVSNGPNGCSDSICQTVSITAQTRCSNISFHANGILSSCDHLQFDVINSGGQVNYIAWSYNGNLMSNNASYDQVITYDSVGLNAQQITCYVSGNGCVSDTVYNFYNPASFYLEVDTTSVSGINIWYAYPYAGGNMNDLWDFGDGNTSTQAAPVHTYSSAGYYNVCHTIVDALGCPNSYCGNQYFFRGSSSGMSQFVVILPITGVNENTASFTTNIYPNPASDIINIDFKKNHEAKTIELVNSLGQSVFKKAINPNSEKLQLALPAVESGFYFLLINGEKASEIKKVIINRQ